ncbi:MAG TPA: hypothetical protein VHE30_17690 [Polyangiaceae bacterium]|nr:hypothetical protein [Polyangiaceae bacterium]
MTNSLSRAAFSALLASLLGTGACGGTHDSGTNPGNGAGSGGSGGDPGGSGGGDANGAGGGAGVPKVDPAAVPCDLHTTWDGDELCIEAPPADQGFQVHVGPTNYDDPDEVAKYVIQAGDETNGYYYLKSANDSDVFFYKRNYRMRPGSHHLIVSEASADHPDGWNTPAAGGAPTSPIGGIDVGRRLGGTQNDVKDNPIGGVLPPENVGIGMPLTAHAQLSVNLHHNNVTDHPILREAWVNFWYVPKEEVTQEAKEMFAVGGFLMSINPGEHTTLHYTCDVTEDGRILTAYGHRHAHNVRFDAWRTRNGAKESIYEGFDWAEPMVLEYSSVVTNPPPDLATRTEGGWSGILDLEKGDVVEWECEVNNDSANTLHFTNETVNGEMCILVGDTVGPAINCVHP